MTTHASVTFVTPVRVALAEGDTPAARTITGLGVPFGVESLPDLASRSRYVFTGPPANPDELVDVVREHDPAAVVGRLAQAWGTSDAGLDATARVFRTRDGDDALELAREGVLTGFSIGTEIERFTEDPGTGVRSVGPGDYTVLHLGVVRRPAFVSTGLTVAASAAPSTGGSTVTTTTEVVELPTIAELSAQLAPVVAEMLADVQATQRHPLAAFATEADYIAALWSAGDDAERVRLVAAFAVPDQITTDNPGVIPPGWRTEIKLNLDDRRPAIAALGSIGLPPAGMDSSWPYLDPTLDLSTIIAEQVAQKADLAGVPIKILKATQPIKTAGTVSDISYQLLTRSSPDYLTAYLAICRAAWAVYTEAVFESTLEAAATTDGTVPVNGATFGDAFATALFAASSKVRTATGAPANVVGVSPNVWQNLGGVAAFRNPAYGTSNVAGVASAATLQINVNGLAIEEWPYLSDDTVIVTNTTTASFPETGPQVATAEDVRKLGRDVAVWGMYEDGEVYFPAGLRKLTSAVVPLAVESAPRVSK